jgi:hypothetical protein
MTAADLAVDGSLTLNIGGFDNSSAQQLFARRIYSHEEIRWNHRYVDITSTSKEGRLTLDPACSTRSPPNSAWTRKTSLGAISVSAGLARGEIRGSAARPIG